MSGIVGIVNLKSAPVDACLLQRLTDSLTFRGPDAQKTWIAGPVGFGHTLLRTGPVQEGDILPANLDERLWIVADSRLDARPELAAKLRARGCPLSADPPDAELLLYAYSEWGLGCVDHLLGDFAFAIWDVSSRRLFCARDHFGFRPLLLRPNGKYFPLQQHPGLLADLPRSVGQPERFGDCRFSALRL